MNSLIVAGFIFLSSFTNTQNTIKLIPGGENIVFDIKTDGLIVTGGYDIELVGSKYNPIDEGNILVGDIIYTLENKKVSSLDDFLEVLKDVKENRSLEVKLKRQNNVIKKELKVFYSNNAIKTGLFVKNDLYGIGTLSFIDPKNGCYGALGHEVYDACSKSIVEASGGNIYSEEVLKIKKGINGIPGEKSSKTELKDKVGDIKINSIYGLFGHYSGRLSKNSITMGRKNELRIGKAYIQTCLNENIISNIEIEITKLEKQEFDSIKGISFQIKDKEFINQYGGIYAGMSGSPIIQDNKIVGVVTHVITSSIINGYGQYIETMYNQMNKNLLN